MIPGRPVPFEYPVSPGGEGVAPQLVLGFPQPDLRGSRAHRQRRRAEAIVPCRREGQIIEACRVRWQDMKNPLHVKEEGALTRPRA